MTRSNCGFHSAPRTNRADATLMAVLLLLLLPSSQAGCIWIPPQPVTRGDLSLAYLEFEEVLAERPLSDTTAADVNRLFDAASLAFFAGNSSSALRDIRALTLKLLDAQSPVDQLAASLKVRVEPPVWVLDSSPAPEARASSMYLVEHAPATVTLRLLLIDRNGREALSLPLIPEISANAGVDARLEIPPSSPLKAGAYQIYVASEQRRFRVGSWQVADASLDAARLENARRLDAIAAPDSAQIAQALATAISRNNLLQDDPSDFISVQFLGDLAQTAEQLTTEIPAIEAGKSPYRRRGGDYWRTVNPSGVEIPMRVYAPAAASTESAAPMPLILAFHGAGGDENMFRFGYGAGALNRLADQRGFILATPLTYPFLLNPQYFDAVVDVLSSDYAIDDTRIYLLGHSLGAGAASILAAQRSDRIAGVFCLAGGRFGTDGPLSPTLVILGELDPLNPLERSKAGVQRAIAAGLPLELRVISNYGHTLLVGNQLESAVNWLLARRLSAPLSKPVDSTQPRNLDKERGP